MENIFIRPLRLPGKIRGVTVTDENGDYNVYLNDYLSEEALNRVYVHELGHIKNNDFFSPEHIKVIENK